MSRVSAAALRDRLDGGERVTLLDVRYYLTEPGRGEREYVEGHIPGAAFIDLDADLAAPHTGPGGRHPLPDSAAFGEAMRRAGVSASVPVVVYDQRTSLSAGRAWWMLVNAGHPRVEVLDGGYAGWVAEGAAVSAGREIAEPGDFEPGPDRLPRVDADQVADLLAAGHRVADVRAPERFRGDVEPIDPVGGHIPGAVNLPAAGLFTPEGTLLPVDELRSRLAPLGPGDAVSCGSGVTAAQVLWALDVAGVPGVALYAGSWSDWISDPSRPVARGE
ncbi:MAG TPA: sulfurtransferase [Propionibacteriaceae bacterium]|nr:sulfurtransferase [Propionibacteriaceae bacterium]